MKAKLAAPVLDAIITAENESAADQQTYSLLLHQIKESLRRDLTYLFNSRQCPISAPAHCTSLSRSLLEYGLPDLISVNLSAPRESQRICDAIEAAVINFEPRVGSVRVSVKGLPDPLEPEFFFRIEAVLKIAQADEMIVFDSALNPITQSVDLREIPDHER